MIRPLLAWAVPPALVAIATASFSSPRQHLDEALLGRPSRALPQSKLPTPGRGQQGAPGHGNPPPGNPIVPGKTGSYILTTSVTGAGEVLRNPDAPAYSWGKPVELTAVADGGWMFEHWEGDLTGSSNPEIIVMGPDRAVTAVFVLDGPPVISGIEVETTDTTATVTWNTDDPATSRVDYGLTEAYGSSEEDLALVTEHTLVLAGLSPETLYHFQVTSTDETGLSSSSSDLTFTTAATPPFVADDFNAFNLDLDTWTWIDPEGDGTLQLTGAGTSDARLRLGVPAGNAHDPFGSNPTVRVMQSAQDVDLDLAIKFESDLDQRYQIQGLIVEQDALDWIRFDFHHDGSRLRAFCATHSNGSPTTRGNVAIHNGPWVGEGPLYMRVTRLGNVWQYWYSFDGLSWTSAVGPFTFGLDVTAVGPFVGNAASGSDPVPAHTAVVDWIEDYSDPILAEDSGTPADSEPPFLYRVQTGPVTDITARIDWFTDEQTTGWVEYGTTTDYELGSSSIVGPAYAPTVLLQGLQALTTYHYRAVSQDQNLATSLSGDYTFTTTDGAGGNVPMFAIWYGTAQGDGTIRQRFGHLGIPQTWTNVLGNVIDPDGSVTSLTYRFNGGPPAGLNLGPDDRRLENFGDFCVEIAYADLLPGDNQVVLTATDDDGNQSQATVVVEYTDGVVGQEDYTIDWTSSPDVQDIVQIVDGKWELRDDMLHVVEWGYDRLFVIGDVTHADYEITMTLTVHALDPEGYDPPSNGPAVGLGMRWNGHTGGGQPRGGFWPTGAFAWYRWRSDGSQFELRTNQYQDNDLHSEPLDLGVPWIFKARCESLGGGWTQYSFKFWREIDSEPAGWTLQVMGTPTDPQAGSILVLGHHVDVDFSGIAVSSLPPGE